MGGRVCTRVWLRVDGAGHFEVIAYDKEARRLNEIGHNGWVEIEGDLCGQRMKTEGGCEHYSLTIKARSVSDGKAEKSQHGA